MPNQNQTGSNGESADTGRTGRNQSECQDLGQPDPNQGTSFFGALRRRFRGDQLTQGNGRARGRSKGQGKGGRARGGCRR